MVKKKKKNIERNGRGNTRIKGTFSFIEVLLPFSAPCVPCSSVCLYFSWPQNDSKEEVSETFQMDSSPEKSEEDTTLSAGDDVSALFEEQV